MTLVIQMRPVTKEQVEKPQLNYMKSRQFGRSTFRENVWL
jgi:hypothetical protein